MRNQISAIQQYPLADTLLDSETALRLRLGDLLHKEEIMWRRKSRSLWLKDGDQNTKFFHLTTVMRRRKNWIRSVKDDSRRMLTTRDEIGAVFIERLSKTFEVEPTNFPQHLNGLIQNSFSPEQVELIGEIPTFREVEAVIKHMNPWKAPSLDGFSGFFLSTPLGFDFK